MAAVSATTRPFWLSLASSPSVSLYIAGPLSILPLYLVLAHPAGRSPKSRLLPVLLKPRLPLLLLMAFIGARLLGLTGSRSC